MGTRSQISAFLLRLIPSFSLPTPRCSFLPIPSSLSLLLCLPLTAFPVHRPLPPLSLLPRRRLPPPSPLPTPHSPAPQWGEHIHLGYYSDAERAAGYVRKDFKKAKYDFIDEMLRFSGHGSPQKVLDVGCGFGGTSRHLAKLFPQASVEGEQCSLSTSL